MAGGTRQQGVPLLQRWCGVGAGLLLALTWVNRSGDPGQYGGGGVCLGMRSAAGHQASATGPTGSRCRAVPSGRWRVAKACRRSRIRAALEQQQNPIFLRLLQTMPTPPPSAPTVVWLHPEAPAKPVEGAPCNGCGLCCLAEPCPLGVLVSRRRAGACLALRWSDADGRYLCGMVVDPGGVTGWTHPWAVRWLGQLARRWIAAGAGCDADVLAHQPPK